ncbi:hypothetical protein BX070DRAFT_218494 [Coemansia spiralis]|nr:hypothetical protein BX070DRAFT_218494 [Coemansia spiralis]
MHFAYAAISPPPPPCFSIGHRLPSFFILCCFEWHKRLSLLREQTRRLESMAVGAVWRGHN